MPAHILFQKPSVATYFTEIKRRHLSPCPHCDLGPSQLATCHPKCVALWWMRVKEVWFLKIHHRRSPPDAWSPSPWGRDSPRCHSSTGCCAGVETTRPSCEAAAGPGSKVGTQCENWWTAAKGAELFNSCMQKSVAQWQMCGCMSVCACVQCYRNGLSYAFESGGLHWGYDSR